MRILSRNSFNCSGIFVLVTVCEVCLFSPKTLIAPLQEHKDTLSPTVKDCTILGNTWWLLSIPLWVFLSEVQVYKNKEQLTSLPSPSTSEIFYLWALCVSARGSVYLAYNYLACSQLYTAAIKWIKMTASPCPYFQNWCIIYFS